MDSSSKPPTINRTKTISTSYGNGLAATSLVSAGTTILSTTSPYHLMPENSVLSKLCSYCLLPRSFPRPNSTSASPPKPPAQGPTSRLWHCASCRIPRYCSLACQKADWKTSHRFECAILALLPKPLPTEVRTIPTEVRAIMQILLRKDRGRPWVGMESHETDFRQNKKLWEDIVLQARAAMTYGRLGEERLGEAAGLLCRIKTNSFRATIQLKRGGSKPIGILFDPKLATANHSCDPNAELQCDGRHVQLVALREIKEGEEIFISYIDQNEPLETRRKILEKRYFFTCSCKRCTEEKERGGDPA